ncbi:GNAT family N-acetyltransferase [Flavobacteriaceae bacterium KMM 6898]|nr:GNAT family N-acetyltransferase [Flavobacteriaceae bacterium KMM 6898]
MMVLKFIVKKNFYFTFFEQQVVPHFYKGVINKNIELPLSEYSPNVNQAVKTLVTCIELFPTYFIPKIEIPTDYKIKKIFRVKGYCIYINNVKNIDSYIQANFKPNLRTSLRRRIKGLETSFDIRYKLFYGQIGRNDYEFLMQALYDMLVRRFNQRDDKHESLLRWDSYYDSVFNLINEKQASLYVIYDDQKPIQISLNYHYDKIVFLAIPSYDIDYAKFGLGNIAVHKLLEWSITNNYEILDMGFGAFDYKLKWCNHNYDFENHLFYKKNSITATIIIHYIALKTQLLNYLISKGVNVQYHKIKSLFSKKHDTGELEYQVDESKKAMTDHLGLEHIDVINDTSYAFLKKSVNDFLYTNLEHISNIEVYEVKKDESYLIKGQKNTQKIVFKS